MRRRKIAWFVTPHGFGHASRSAAVIEAVGRRDPDIVFDIITTVPTWFFEQTLSVAFRVWPVTSDVGLVQVDPVREDLPATVASLDAFWSSLPQTVDALVERWAGEYPDVVISDISPLGLAVGQRLGVASVLVENFTWDWIYRAYFELEPRLESFAGRVAELDRAATLHVQCRPFCEPRHGAFTVPPVSRRSRQERAAVRRRLGLAPDDPRAVVLLTMGGMGWGESVPDLGDEVFVVVLGGVDELRRGRSHVVLPNRSPIYPPDLVQAADLVIAKLGYSTIAECFQSGTRLGFIRRPAFPESAVLEAFATDSMSAHPVEPGSLAEDHGRRQVEMLLSLPEPAGSEANGAETVADRLLALIA